MAVHNAAVGQHCCVPLRDIQPYFHGAPQSQLPAGSTAVPADHQIVTRYSDTISNLDKPFRSSGKKWPRTDAKRRKTSGPTILYFKPKTQKTQENVRFSWVFSSGGGI